MWCVGWWELAKGRLTQRGQHEQKYRGMEAAGDEGWGRVLLSRQYKLEHKQGGQGVSGEESEEFASPDLEDT